MISGNVEVKIKKIFVREKEKGASQNRENIHTTESENHKKCIRKIYGIYVRMR
jgi:hypothetical protein